MTNEEMIERMQDFKLGREISLGINNDEYTLNFCKEDIEWANGVINALEKNSKLKLENERLKELMPKICETCEYEDEIGYEEPCNSCNNRRNWKLKSGE